MSNSLPRCRVVPLPDHRVALEVDGVRRLRWHFGPGSPRPFFFPMLGPSGQSLTRMGHPGAPNHDHHRSIWFAHHDVQGSDFWSEDGGTRIRQLQWLAYQDGDEEAVMAVKLGWFGAGQQGPLLEQEMVATVRPGPVAGETCLELQASFLPVENSVEFRKSNFGFVGVRVARSLSVHFGGGMLTDSEGRQGEQAIFGNEARWMDYSGPVGTDQQHVVEGITYFDHPQNPGYPSAWHVREDGWMCCSSCMKNALTVEPGEPLQLRFLLHAHAGAVNLASADALASQFARLTPWRVKPSTRPHTQFEVGRAG